MFSLIIKKSLHLHKYISFGNIFKIAVNNFYNNDEKTSFLFSNL